MNKIVKNSIKKTMSSLIWLRDECKKGEHRTPLTPQNADFLLKNGFKIIVEKSLTRIFKDEEYKEVGCELVESQTWYDAPKNATILGLKELPLEGEFNVPNNLEHLHIYFAHCFKG
jgi:saccharopine dehydrogenase (NAD+, L-lysine forming)